MNKIISIGLVMGLAKEALGEIRVTQDLVDRPAQQFAIQTDFEGVGLGRSSFNGSGKLQGWEAKNGEIGVGETYNQQWGPQNRVINLDSGTNIDYLIQLDLPEQGTYRLIFNFGANQQQSLESSAFTITINDQVEKVTPINYEIVTYSAFFPGVKGSNKIMLSGAGLEDGFGATIDNVIISKAEEGMNGQNGLLYSLDQIPSPYSLGIDISALGPNFLAELLKMQGFDKEQVDEYAKNGSGSGSGSEKEFIPVVVPVTIPIMVPVPVASLENQGQAAGVSSQEAKNLQRHTG